MVYNIVNGDCAADALKAAFLSSDIVQEEIFVLRDLLNVGPLQKENGQKFSDLRSLFWQEITNNDKSTAQVDDLERLLTISNHLAQNENSSIRIWIASLSSDACTYLWILNCLKKHTGRIFVVNISGLPFLNEEGKLFYPTGISDLPAKEVKKAKLLSRKITDIEFENAGEEWSRLVMENGGIRIFESNKKLVSQPIDWHDKLLLSYCTPQFQKASKIIHQTLTKNLLPVGDLFLGYRLRKLHERGMLQMQGDTTRSLKDFELKLTDVANQTQLEH